MDDFLLRSRMNLPLTTGTAPVQNPALQRPAGSTGQNGPSFRQMLEKMAGSEEISFSKHAAGRIEHREIPMTESGLEKLRDGMEIARERGIRDALILMDGSAFIVSAKNSTVITAMNSQELKNKPSHRTVPIPRPLQEILAATPRIGLHVVTCADGRPMTSSGFQSLWDIVRQKSPCEIRAHMLRHSYCSNLYRAGIDLKTAQYLMGHSTIEMTANVYTHLAKEDTAASVIQLEKYLATGSQETGDFSESSQKVVIG